MFIRLADKHYPMTAAQIIAAHPNVSFPIPFEPIEGYALVAEGARPMVDNTTMKAVEMDPVPIPGGGYVASWRVAALSADEIADRASKAPARLQAEGDTVLQNRLDAFARTRGYDDIRTLCSYASDPNPAYSAEGARGVELRSATWSKWSELMEAVKSGARPIPAAFADLEGELPVLTWGEA